MAELTYQYFCNRPELTVIFILYHIYDAPLNVI